MNETILAQFTLLVEFLGKALGSDYEIVLRDLTKEENPIIAIANRHITNRDLDSPLTNVSLQLLSNDEKYNQDYIYNTQGISSDGRVLRSSTLLIKNEKNQNIGMLGVHFDDSRFIDSVDELLKIVHPKNFKKLQAVYVEDSNDVNESNNTNYELFLNEIEGSMENIYQLALTNTGLNNTDKLNSDKKIKIVKELSNLGLFQLKDAVQFTSKKLNVSVASVYRYLNEI